MKPSRGGGGSVDKSRLNEYPVPPRENKGEKGESNAATFVLSNPSLIILFFLPLLLYGIYLAGSLSVRTRSFSRRRIGSSGTRKREQLHSIGVRGYRCLKAIGDNPSFARSPFCYCPPRFDRTRGSCDARVTQRQRQHQPQKKKKKWGKEREKRQRRQGQGRRR